jgi:hypothetical protein
VFSGLIKEIGRGDLLGATLMEAGEKKDLKKVSGERGREVVGC